MIVTLPLNRDREMRRSPPSAGGDRGGSCLCLAESHSTVYGNTLHRDSEWLSSGWDSTFPGRGHRAGRVSSPGLSMSEMPNVAVVDVVLTAFVLIYAFFNNLIHHHIMISCSF